jgi:hypothetical protein
VISLFTVTWPNGQKVPFGLNCERLSDSAVLYTSAVGGSTRTGRGRDLILEKSSNGPWLPLQVSETYSARVREVRETGDAPVSPGTMVLSLGPQVAARLPAIAPGASLKISTATLPELHGVKTAIGGGPTLVRHGKAQQWNGNQPRHPRTAIGWNATNLFLVQVDGRQGRLSVGMSFPELAEYMVKLGCDEAMNLDGGGSSTLWAFGQVMNSPCYGHERDTANALVIIRKPQPQTPPKPAEPSDNPPD